jgi:hypothetical protein
MSLKSIQKSQVEKLMAEPDKPVEIPEKKEEWKPPEPPEFKRFYMGSSAGAGSEVFHVYRHLRRYEMIRQQHINETAEKEDKDTEFQQRLAQKRAEDEARTSKKRAKRYFTNTVELVNNKLLGHYNLFFKEV